MSPDRHKREQADTLADAVVQEISAREPRVQKARARYELVKRALQAVTALVAVACLALLIYLSASANAAADAVRDCTEPGGACYTRSQTRTAQVVGQIVKAQEKAVATGSAPARESLAVSKANAHSLAVVLGILDREYPEAAAAVRAELSREGK
jgi:hypothetical protein